MAKKLYNSNDYFDSCGVGFITTLDNNPTHEIITIADKSLCTIPHRGGMNAQGVGDGAGVNVDISNKFFNKITNKTLTPGKFAVGNFFIVKDIENTKNFISKKLEEIGCEILMWRDIPVNNDAINNASQKANQTQYQIIVEKTSADENFEIELIKVQDTILEQILTNDYDSGFFVSSLSCKNVVYKGLLNSFEVINYFKDLQDKDFEIKTLLFHSRFSTNTHPVPYMAQPFSRIAHNGELNTDKKNRISEKSILATQGKNLITPKGQSDSAKFDQTIARRICDGMGIMDILVKMSPPAFENSNKFSKAEKDMFKFFAMSEEKIDGPAALVFTDGNIVGAKLDRLGLRPLRVTKTKKYLMVMSESGQCDFDASEIVERDKIPAGEFIIFDHSNCTIKYSKDIIKELLENDDYAKKLDNNLVELSSYVEKNNTVENIDKSNIGEKLYIKYGHNVETFRFMMDPYLETGAEKVSAMGYDSALNIFESNEFNISRFFTQRFAQVTNPPLDSIRESDGLSLNINIGAKPNFTDYKTKQIFNDSPILSVSDINNIKSQNDVNIDIIKIGYTPSIDDAINQNNFDEKIKEICEKAEQFAKNNGIIILSDINIDDDHSPIFVQLIIAAVNHHLINKGLRFNTSIIVETMQTASSHDIATCLGFGATAICPVLAHARIIELYDESEYDTRFTKYKKGIEKALLKTMGKYGLCTVESYIGGEFFEGSFIATKNDEKLKEIFANINSPLGGFTYNDIAKLNFKMYEYFLNNNELLNLGLFKEKNDGLSHTFGVKETAKFVDIANEKFIYAKDAHLIPHGTWVFEQNIDAEKQILGDDKQYLNFGYEKLSEDTMNGFKKTPSFVEFCDEIATKRASRPAAIRDILTWNLENAKPISIDNVEKISDITKTFAGGAMSFGALTLAAHQAISVGSNIVGALSNSGEGGEKRDRYNSHKSSAIKQIASGRFGVWAGYFADPNLKEIEIKMAQGAKPGEGGQLPSPKVTVEISSMRGSTPMIELVSPPPHHDTYSIEDLAQLIHDAHCARVKVIVKLVSSEGIGTIAVGVAKAGADVINIAGASGGTGAAQISSLKNTGRYPEIGIAEVHQALSENGLRDKVTLRASAAHQLPSDVIKSAILGADSFEFGTTALMMIGCIMAKNCNVKCPVGITTDPDIFEGDARALSQYYLNMAYEVREILASLGVKSLNELKGRTDLLKIIDHPSITGKIDIEPLLYKPTHVKFEDEHFLEANFDKDNEITPKIIEQIKAQSTKIHADYGKLVCLNKSVAGQLSIDIERMLSWEIEQDIVKNMKNVSYVDDRPVLKPYTVNITSHNSAGQSYGAWLTSGIYLKHNGTCNDGVAKGMSGGVISISDENFDSQNGKFNNVLIGNFALFGATGGKAYIAGGAGDRFAVRNTGAKAVVEGVGDFFCEYMVNGSVINIGSFGHGWGNGVSGGVIYQYDPQNKLEDYYSKESVKLFNLVECEANLEYVYQTLTSHVEHTGSIKAKSIIENWEHEKQFFKFGLPIAFINTQTPKGIVENNTKESLIKELTNGIFNSTINEIKKSYKNETPVFDGKISSLKDQSLVASTLFVNQLALNYAKTYLEKQGIPVDEYMTNLYARKFIINKDNNIVSGYMNIMRDAFDEFDIEHIGVWVSEKRISDYKESLKNRDTKEIHAFGATVWIIDNNMKNADVIKNIGTCEEFLIDRFAKSIIELNG